MSRSRAGPNLRTHKRRRRPREGQLLGLIERCYDAALEPQLWTDFLAGYADAVGGSSANMHSQNLSGGVLHFLHAFNLPTTSLQQYGEYYHQHDVWVPGALKQRHGTVLTNDLLVDQQEFKASEFYNDFLLPIDTCQINSVLLGSDPSAFGVMTAFRSRHKDDFEEAEHEVARRLYPHVRRAMRIAEQLQGLEAKRDRFRDSLAMLPQPLFLIGADGNVFFMNQAAATLITEADELDVRQGRLIATQVPAAQALADLLAGALAWFDNPLVAAGGIVLVPRLSDRPGLALHVTPLGSGLAEGFRHRRCVAVYAGDPEREPASVAERLIAAFGLTPAEARLAEGLVQGARLNDLADIFGITIGTARAQLKAVFQKTHTNSQAELMRLILLTLGGLPHPQMP